jgi:uncharacterized membrane protein YdfJ with MMPL/SSD domain
MLPELGGDAGLLSDILRSRGALRGVLYHRCAHRCLLVMHEVTKDDKYLSSPDSPQTRNLVRKCSPQKKIEYSTPQNQFFKKWVKFFLRNKWFVLLASFIITGFMLHQIIQDLQVDNSTEAFVRDKAEEVVILEELYDDFGQDRIYQILVAGDVFSMDCLERVKRMHDEMAAIDLEIPSLGQRKKVAREKRSGNVLEMGGAKSVSPKKAAPKKTAKDNGLAAFDESDDTSDDAFAEFEGDEGWGEGGRRDDY